MVYDEWIEVQEALLGDLWRYACWLERLPSAPALLDVDFIQAFVSTFWAEETASTEALIQK